MHSRSSARTGLDDVAPFVVDFVTDVASRCSFASVSRRFRSLARGTSIVVEFEEHLRPQIWIAGDLLTDVTIHVESHDELIGMTNVDVDDLAGLDALPPGTVDVRIVEKDVVRWVTLSDEGIDESITNAWRAILDKPAVRTLRLANVHLDDDTAELMRNPKFVMDGTLNVASHFFFSDAKQIYDEASDIVPNILLRGCELHTLRLNETWVPLELLTAMTARHVHLYHVSLPVSLPASAGLAEAIASNACVKELTYAFEDAEDVLELATLLRLPHDYSDGITIETTCAETSGLVHEPDPEIGRRLAEALASPGLRVGRRLSVDTTFAISERGVPDDGLLVAIAGCAWRNEALREIDVDVSGVPWCGDDGSPGGRALLQLPAHVTALSIRVFEEHSMDYIVDGDVFFHPPGGLKRRNDWLWDALRHVDLPGVADLTLECHYGILGILESESEYHACGLALALNAPNLRRLKIVAADEHANYVRMDAHFRNPSECPPVDAWMKPFMAGFATRGACHAKTTPRMRMTLTFEK